MAQSTPAAAQALSCLAAPLGHDHGPLLSVPVAGPPTKSGFLQEEPGDSVSAWCYLEV